MVRKRIRHRTGPDGPKLRRPSSASLLRLVDQSAPSLAYYDAIVTLAKRRCAVERVLPLAAKLMEEPDGDASATGAYALGLFGCGSRPYLRKMRDRLFRLVDEGRSPIRSKGRYTEKESHELRMAELLTMGIAKVAPRREGREILYEFLGRVRARPKVYDTIAAIRRTRPPARDEMAEPAMIKLLGSRDESVVIMGLNFYAGGPTATSLPAFQALARRSGYVGDVAKRMLAGFGT